MARSFAFALIFALCLTQTLSVSMGGGGFRGGSSAPRMSSPAPRVSAPSIRPSPAITHRPSTPAPRPSIPAHRPSAPAPRPSIPAPKPVHKPVVAPTPKPVVHPTPARPTPTHNPTPRPNPIHNPTHRPTPTTPKPSGAQTPSSFYQVNPAWKNVQLGNGHATIGSGGCAISSLAAMVDKAGVKINGAAPNALSMNNWLKSNGGFSGSDVKWDTLGKLGFKHTADVGSGNKAAITSALGQGKSAVLNVGGHYVYATGSDATGFTVVDPGHQYRNHYTFDQVHSAKIFSR